LETENKDKGDGQGYWNGARTNAVNDLVAWLSTDPTQSGDPDYLILGDMNSYNYEDPIMAFKNAGYEDLIPVYVGLDAYTYGFDGQWGAIDHALANTDMTRQIAGATIWHVNADESPAFGYAGRWSSADKYRYSDHDPVIVGLNLSSLSRYE
jgi:predicted extracellular nuclease